MGWFGLGKNEDGIDGIEHISNKEDDKEDENEEAEEDENTYVMELVCDNCGYATEFEMPIGTKAIEFKKKQNCENCGCCMYQETKTDEVGRSYHYFE